MLTHLTVRNYAIVECLELELQPAMTVISGETGAGKSIMLDALSLALGARADSDSVRHTAERAEISASFDLTHLQEARQWLQEHALDQDDNHECIIRRVITREGRSRSYINGHTCPLGHLKQLGEYLVAIHGQHEHQRLLKKEYHRQLLDQFANHTPLVRQVEQRYKDWQHTQRQLDTLRNQSAEQQAKVQLLRYQVEELDQLNLTADELTQLDKEQHMLSQAETLLQNGQQILAISVDDEEDNCLQRISRALQLLGDIKQPSRSLQQAQELFNSAYIQIEEASQELRHYLDRVEISPQRLSEVEERLSSIYDMARKHRITAAELPEFHQQLQQQLAECDGGDEALERLAHEAEQQQQHYLTAAQQLSTQRQQAASRLNAQVDQLLQQLGMHAAQFTVRLQPLTQPGLHGLEDTEFLIAANQGQPARALAKVASGGELSRISLAIQVITAQTSDTPTLVFDEVDVGIGGAIAEVVGRLLKQLGARAQILCVTHQPQVAAQGHQHLFVSKQADQETTHTQISLLNTEERVTEIARMLGGIDLTQRSLDHAQEMLLSQ